VQRQPETAVPSQLSLPLPFCYPIWQYRGGASRGFCFPLMPGAKLHCPVDGCGKRSDHWKRLGHPLPLPDVLALLLNEELASDPANNRICHPCYMRHSTLARGERTDVGPPSPPPDPFLDLLGAAVSSSPPPSPLSSPSSPMLQFFSLSSPFSSPLSSSFSSPISHMDPESPLSFSTQSSSLPCSSYSLPPPSQPTAPRRSLSLALPSSFRL
jgi:hypothetical protein